MSRRGEGTTGGNRAEARGADWLAASRADHQAARLAVGRFARQLSFVEIYHDHRHAFPDHRNVSLTVEEGLDHRKQEDDVGMYARSSGKITTIVSTPAIVVAIGGGSYLNADHKYEVRGALRQCADSLLSTPTRVSTHLSSAPFSAPHHRPNHAQEGHEKIEKGHGKGS